MGFQVLRRSPQSNWVILRLAQHPVAGCTQNPPDGACGVAVVYGQMENTDGSQRVRYCLRRCFATDSAPASLSFQQGVVSVGRDSIFATQMPIATPSQLSGPSLLHVPLVVLSPTSFAIRLKPILGSPILPKLRERLRGFASRTMFRFHTATLNRVVLSGPDLGWY
jgi:hypothetical protein